MTDKKIVDCVNPECDERFVLDMRKKSWRKYCTKACKMAHWHKLNPRKRIKED